MPVNKVDDTTAMIRDKDSCPFAMGPCPSAGKYNKRENDIKLLNKGNKFKKNVYCMVWMYSKHPYSLGLSGLTIKLRNLKNSIVKSLQQ